MARGSRDVERRPTSSPPRRLCMLRWTGRVDRVDRVAPSAGAAARGLRLSKRAERSSHLLAVVLIAGLSAGCGKGLYEERLRRTAEYFEHVNRLNDNLAPQATVVGGVALRVPRQFQPMADDPETEYDETTPYYLGADVPGSVAAFRGDLRVDVDGQVERHPAFLYVLSNEPLLQAQADGDQSVEPAGFFGAVEAALQEAFGVVLPTGVGGDGSEPNERYPERLPRVATYHLSKNFTAVRFQPAEPLPGFPVPMESTLYMVEGPQDLRAAIFLIAPAGPDPKEQLRQRVTLMLESLELPGPQVTAGPTVGEAPRGI